MARHGHVGPESERGPEAKENAAGGTQESPAVPRHTPPANLLEERTQKRRRFELLAIHRRGFDEMNAQMAAESPRGKVG